MDSTLYSTGMVPFKLSSWAMSPLSKTNLSNCGERPRYIFTVDRISALHLLGCRYLALFIDLLIIFSKPLSKVIIEKSRGGRFIWNRNSDLGQLALLKKSHLGWLWTTFEAGFFKFSWVENKMKWNKNIVVSALKSWINNLFVTSKKKCYKMSLE